MQISSHIENSKRRFVESERLQRVMLIYDMVNDYRRFDGAECAHLYAQTVQDGTASL